MGRILQTYKSCSNIIDHIALKVRTLVCTDIVQNKRKICIIVDKSTLSNTTMLIICLGTAKASDKEVITFF